MSNLGLIIAERSRDIGDFLVGRLILFRKKRMIGPFVFIDHMDLTELGPTKYMDVDQHPHIGLSTVTYMLEGGIIHEDSIGTQQRITPGSVNLMVAGKGVSHTERTPKDLRHGQTFKFHGYQIWIALPKIKEDCSPEFHHIEAALLPQWEEGSAKFKLIAGEGYGRTSPVPAHSPLFMIEIKNTLEFELNTKDHLKGEIGICIVEGSINTCGDVVGKGNILVFKIENTYKTVLNANAHLLLFGGLPLPEERHIYWNFVSSSTEKNEIAKKACNNRLFPMMGNDLSFVSLPN
ncbi:pirin family protein [Sediminicola arcticus]|uniref:Pirin family protein n=1 Tax=Sediminicola arcticus TaxID=1574308 RepID=A0ABV2SV05_9FLAO